MGMRIWELERKEYMEWLMKSHRIWKILLMKDVKKMILICKLQYVNFNKFPSLILSNIKLISPN